MVAKHISLAEIIDTLKLSISYGKKHYLIFFLGALSLQTATTLISELPSIALATVIASTIFSAGQIRVAQIVSTSETAPTYGDYFIGFVNTSILKRLVPCFILSIVLTIIVTLLGVFTTMLLSKMIYKLNAPSSATTLIIVLQVVFTIFALVPLLFYPYILILQKNDWRKSLSICIRGILKNIDWAIVSAIFLSVVGFISFQYIIGMKNLTDDNSVSYLKWGLSSVSTVLSPFVMIFYYLIYKKVFSFSKKDLIVSKKTTY